MDSADSSPEESAPTARDIKDDAVVVPSAEGERIEPAPFSAVCIGASAGGLEALEQFFDGLPDDPGFAVIVVQHLSPDFDSHMQELLGRRTRLPVLVAEDEMEIRPDHVYLMPPKADMVISRRRLILSDRDRDLLSRPIDQFMHSLAADFGRFSIGVILSGTGSDGARGIRSIHEAGGLVAAQEAKTAKFDGMPQAVIDTGLADFVYPPPQLVKALVRHVQGGMKVPAPTAADGVAQESSSPVDQAFQLLRDSFGIDFALYKDSTVQRRLHRRCDLLRIDSLQEYVERLHHDTVELNELYKDLLIGVTRFFRDSDAFDCLAAQVIPEIVRENRTGVIRVWTAGCATGEETYSLAMLFDEEIRRQQASAELKIFATDAHRDSLQRASRGVYPTDQVDALSDERKIRYFRRHEEGYQVSKSLRSMVVFAPHNVINDAPFTQMHLVSCRNLLIYLRSNAQQKALTMFNFALRSGGILFLGPSETPGDMSEFTAVDRRLRIYRKEEDVRVRLQSSSYPIGTGNFTSPASIVGAPRSGANTPLASTYDELLRRFMPPGILVTEQFEILHTFGDADRFLSFPQGRMTSSVLELVAPSLRSSLHAAVLHCLRNEATVRYSGVKYDHPSGTERLTLSIQPIFDSTTKRRNLLILLETETRDLGEGGSGVKVEEENEQDRIRSLERDLQTAHENLQVTVEEMETSNEELQASNEELVASNEELQSTNEELHSVNEELYTVNAEHQRRVEELAQANEDMDNLLGATRVGVVFLDSSLLIRRFTPEVGRVLHLLDRDIGRSIESFAHHVCYPPLLDDLRRVAETGQPKEIETVDQRGEQLLLRMTPYASSVGSEDVVLTMINISTLKESESDRQRFQFMAEAATDGFMLVDSQLTIEYGNPALGNVLGCPSSELAGCSLLDFCSEQGLAVIQQWTGGEVDLQHTLPFEADLIRRDGSLVPVEISPSGFDFEGRKYLFAAIRDISEREEHRSLMEQMGRMVDAAYDAIVVWRLDGGILSWNIGAEDLYGYKATEVQGRSTHEVLQTEHDLPWSQIHQTLVSKGQWTGTLQQKTKDGESIIVSTRHQLLHGPRGELRVLEINRDITRERRALDKLEQAKQLAQRANQAKSEFLASMSHELRTPLTALLGFAEMLDDQLQEESQRDQLSTIKKNGEYLLSLLNDILDLSKIEAGKMDVGHDPVDLPGLVDDVRSLMHVRAVQAGIPLEFEFATAIPQQIRTDAVRVRQILVNLIGNALKFTSQGSVRVLVRVAQGEGGPPRLEFEVRDTGIGMSQQEMVRLFEPFERGDRAKVQHLGGTGLGLNISKRLADRLGGDIRVASKLDEGSQFMLVLPLETDDMETMVNPQEQRCESSTRDAESEPQDVPLNGRILVADDRRDIWRVARFFLEKAGAEVTIAEDGRQAVDLVEEAEESDQSFDAILMDMQMPVMNGREAVQTLRRMGLRIPIIALTADAMEGEREACLEIGCDDYLPKPINGPRLIATLAQYLQSST